VAESTLDCAIFFDVSGTLLQPNPSQISGYEICSDAIEILAKCRARLFAGQSVKTGAITNWGDRVHSLFNSLKIMDCFDFVIHAQPLGAIKPQKIVFEKACTLVNLLPAQCVHIGDSLFQDALGAQNAGLHGIWIERDSEAFYSLSERALISSLRYEPITSLKELEGICELIFESNQRRKQKNDSKSKQVP
jgi:putative hydrolase of the HAD superfamily